MTMLATTRRYRIELAGEDDSEAWRKAARQLIAAKVTPDAVDWVTPGTTQASLFGESSLPPDAPSPAFSVPPSFLTLVDSVILHRDQVRFDLLYRLLHRIVADRRAVYDSADPLMRRAAVMAKEVRRDIHKMRAFVRFRLVEDGVPDRPHYVAWFEPEHHIVRANAEFFVRRFASMRWSILTPDLSIHWDGEQLVEAPGASRDDAPQSDEMEDLWRGYYASIFNPARLKVQAMVKEMPRKYWKNLPEAQAIPGLITSAQAREARMIASGPADVGPPPASWEAIESGIMACTRCPIGCNGSRAVMGEGPRDAAIMIVGEQPGDVEEREGRPFVGPAGQLLDHYLSQAGIDRASAYLTNGVKHFKHALKEGPRGKIRLHKTPSPREVDICRWWLDGERSLVKPKHIIALGASAVRAITGRSEKITAIRGRATALPDGAILHPTIHPSYLLRLPDETRRAVEAKRFAEDLERVGLKGF